MPTVTQQPHTDTNGGRTPPQDIAAEQSALGGMLLSKDAIADVVEILRSEDFYRPNHATVFDAVINLYGRGEPADAITVAAFLQDAGDLTRVGGATYLHTLISSVPTAANASYYARIVGERAVLRRLLEANIRISQDAYAGGDADDIVDRAQQAMYDLTERRTGDDFVGIGDLMQPTLDQIESNATSAGLLGVPTGFHDLDRLLMGLQPGQLIVVAGRPGLGKALALDTPLPTPTGWTTMGEVKAGDYLLGADRRPTAVVHAFDVLYDRPCYRVQFDDRSNIIADGGHLWAIGDGDGQPEILTTEQIITRTRTGSRVATTRLWADIRWITDITPSRSVPVRCVTVDNPDHLYLAGPTGIPTHNSTAGLDICRSASIRRGMASAVFSLEMSKIEIVTRLLSAEAKVPLNVLRSGQLSDDDWTRLARRMGEISEAPIFIDDSPGLNLMEIRAKARRLKQRHDLRLIVVDYLQLMSSPKRVESRQQEVSDLSRGLKLLAKELAVPVIAVSQLNRGPEQRTDKRPQLSDLRESGCLTADTTLLRADTGGTITFADLLRDGYEGVQVWSLDEDRRMVAAPITNVFPSGEKETFLLKLTSGREVKATGNHQFLTFEGWQPLDALTVGARIAVPRRTPAPTAGGLGWSEHRMALLAYLIADGTVLPRHAVQITDDDPDVLAYTAEAAAAEFGITARHDPGIASRCPVLFLPSPYHLTHNVRNPIQAWFRELGINGLRSAEKRIPDVVFGASDQEVGWFLKHLLATDGCVTQPGKSTSGGVRYDTTSRAVADGVARLLSRFGIMARIRQTDQGKYNPIFYVLVNAGPDIRTFATQVGAFGRAADRLEKLVEASAAKTTNTNVDTVPHAVWNLVEAERYKAGLTGRQFQAAIGTHYCGTSLFKAAPSRERLMRCAEVLNSDPLRDAASDDVFWDQVASVEPLGVAPVYDATVKGTHNFIAGGIVAHNSIEQDADVVILLHRDDYYDKESPRAGEADFIVAKHRNGPTDTVTVAAQLHFCRFVDMAIN